jgi:septal ring factor EnvC (AmiA/AmiB activator)
MLIVQGLWLRRTHQGRLAALQARHAQYQREVNSKFEAQKRQVSQLQGELGAARQRLAQAEEAAAAPVVRIDPAARRIALERELDDGDRAAGPRSTDGFEDTQVSMQDTDDMDLLLR